MIAIIRTGGKQYLVKPNQTIQVEKLPGAEGDAVDLETLMVADEKGATMKVGTPIVAGTVVKAKISSQGRAKKVDVIKFKSKIRYARKYGHRQPFTNIVIGEFK